MRLSATERIIREAEEQDAGKASSRNRDSGRVGEPLPATVTARDPPESYTWPRSFEVDVDGIELSDDEDKTQVNTEKAAAALQEMRSYEPPRRRPPQFNATPPPSTDALLESGPVVSTPAPKAQAAVLPVFASAGILEATDTHPGARALFSMPVSFDVVRPRHAVGRRLGILIAAATTVVVALGVGAWTTDWGHLAISDVTHRSLGGKGASVIRPMRAPRVPIAASIVPVTTEAPAPRVPLASPPSAVASQSSAAAAAPASVPAAAAVSAPALAPAPAPLPASPTENPSAPDPGSPASGSASAGTHHGQPSATSDKPRPSRKLTAKKSRRRRSHTAKVGASHSRSNRAVEVANPPTMRPLGATPRNVDPDSTLPITE